MMKRILIILLLAGMMVPLNAIVAQGSNATEPATINAYFEVLPLTDTASPVISNFTVSPSTAIGKSRPAIASAHVEDANLSEVEFIIIDSDNRIFINQTAIGIHKNLTGANANYTSPPWDAVYVRVTNATLQDSVTVISLEGCPDCEGNYLANAKFKKNASENEINVDAWFNKSTMHLSRITAPQGPEQTIENGTSTIRFGRIEFANGINNPPEKNYSLINYTLYSIGDSRNPYLLSSPVLSGNYTVLVHAVDAADNHNSTYINITADTTPPESVTNLHNVTYAPYYINWTWNDPADPDLDHISFVFKYSTGVIIQASTLPKGQQYYNATYNETGLPLYPDTEYVFIITQTVDTSGNINETQVTATSRTAVVTVEKVSIDLPSLPANITNSSGVINTSFGSYEWTVVTNGTTVPVTLDVTVSSSVPPNATNIALFAGAIPDLYYEINVSDPAWFNNVSQVQFKAYYNASDIPLNVAESTLRAYRFATTWQRLDCASFSGGCSATLNDSAILYAAGVNESGNYVYANLSRFSTFAIAGTVSAAGVGAPSTGGTGGTGGSGVVTSEPYANIEKAERYDKSLIANTPVTYAFKTPELSIYEIAVTGKESENDIAIRVEALKGMSKLVKEPAPGIVYRNVNVWSGTKRIKEVLIRFKVEYSWLESNSLAGSDVVMVKWDGGKWVQLETTGKPRDKEYKYYEAKTDTLSIFAIVGLKGAVMPTETAAVVTETPVPEETTPTAAPTEVPGFGIALAIATLSALYVLSKRR